MIEGLVQGFMQEPLKNFLLIFGGGGLLAACFKWGLMWVDRRRIRVRVLSEHFDTQIDPNIQVELRFEVTNVGDKVTSLEPDVRVRSVTPKRKLTSFVLQIQEPDRQLPPHAQRHFTATAIVDAVYPFYWFKRYSFRVLRSSGAIIRYRNAQNEDIRFVRYWGEYVLFRWLGRLVNAA